MPNLNKATHIVSSNNEHISILEIVDRAFYRAREYEDDILTTAKGKPLNAVEREQLFEAYPDIAKIERKLKSAETCEYTVYEYLTHICDGLSNMKDSTSMLSSSIADQAKRYMRYFVTLTDNEQKQISNYKNEKHSNDSLFKCLSDLDHAITHNYLNHTLAHEIAGKVRAIMAKYKNDLQETEFLSLDKFESALKLSDEVKQAIMSQTCGKDEIENKPKITNQSKENEITPLLNYIHKEQYDRNQKNEMLYHAMSQFILLELNKKVGSFDDASSRKNLEGIQQSLQDKSEHGAKLSDQLLHEVHEQLTTIYARNTKKSFLSIFDKGNDYLKYMEPHLKAFGGDFKFISKQKYQ